MRQSDIKHRRKPRVRTWLTLGITGFVTVGLLLLLIFQTVFLDDLYEFGKIQTVKYATDSIADTYGSESFEKEVEYWSIKEGCEIYTVDSNGETVSLSGGSMVVMKRLSAGELKAYYHMAEQSEDGTVFSKVKLDFRKLKKVNSPPQYNDSDDDRKPPMQHDTNSQPQVDIVGESVLYAKLVQTQESDAPVMVLTMSMVTPVDATIRVLRVQLMIAIVLFILMSILLAWFMGRSIATPIIRINRAAKGLASGTYEPPIKGKYREIAELQETLTVIDGELRKSEQLQRELIANVSHDLRTPLTMIIGYGEAIRDLPGEDSAENIQVVIDEAERLSRLVNDVLDLSKLKSGVEQFELVPTNLTENLRDVVLRIGRMMHQDGYTIDLIADEDVIVSADEVRLSQIVYNLLINALAYTGDDKRVVVTQTVKGERVRVSFTDSGKGIPEQELSGIWLRYYQVHSHERRQGAMNSGLGLSIVHALVTYHGGTCGVESEVGKGSTFWFEFPCIS